MDEQMKWDDTEYQRRLALLFTNMTGRTPEGKITVTVNLDDRCDTCQYDFSSVVLEDSMGDQFWIDHVRNIVGVLDALPDE